MQLATVRLFNNLMVDKHYTNQYCTSKVGKINRWKKEERGGGGRNKAFVNNGQLCLRMPASWVPPKSVKNNRERRNSVNNGRVNRLL